MRDGPPSLTVARFLDGSNGSEPLRCLRKLFIHFPFPKANLYLDACFYDYTEEYQDIGFSNILIKADDSTAIAYFP